MRTAVLTLSVLLLLMSACSRERRDWREAQGADSLEAYEGFVRAHPDSEFAAPARERLAQLLQARDWQRAAATDAARAGRASAAATAPDAGYAVQLGAFSSAARAQEAWRVLAGSYAELAQAVPRVLNGGDQLYRLQLPMPDETHARRVCALLQGHGEPCVVVPSQR